MLFMFAIASILYFIKSSLYGCHTPINIIVYRSYIFYVCFFLVLLLYRIIKYFVLRRVEVVHCIVSCCKRSRSGCQNQKSGPLPPRKYDKYSPAPRYTWNSGFIL